MKQFKEIRAIEGGDREQKEKRQRKEEMAKGRNGDIDVVKKEEIEKGERDRQMETERVRQIQRESDREKAGIDREREG